MITELRYARILIIDDNDLSIEMIKMFLQNEGYCNIESISDPTLTLSTVHEYKPHLVLLDLNMPHKSGFDVLEELQTNHMLDSNIAVIILTADECQEYKDKALLAGAKDYLTKPLQAVEAKMRINNQLNSIKMMQQMQRYNLELESMVEQRTREVVKEKERAEKNEKKFVRLFNENHDSILLYEIDQQGHFGNIFEANESGAQSLAYQRDEILLKTLPDIEPHTPFEEMVKRHQYLLKHQRLEFESMYQTKEGKMLVVQVRNTVLSLDGRNIVLSIAHDITERTEHLRTLQQQNKALRQYSWSQSHELRSPVARMKGIIELIQQTDISEEEMSSFWTIMLDSIEEMDRVIYQNNDMFTQTTFSSLKSDHSAA